MPPRWSLDSSTTSSSCSSIASLQQPPSSSPPSSLLQHMNEEDDDISCSGHIAPTSGNSSKGNHPSTREYSSLVENNVENNESQDVASSNGDCFELEDNIIMINNTKCNENRRKKKKSVHFAEYASMHWYYRYKSDATIATWYSNDELQVFKYDVVKTVNMIVNGGEERRGMDDEDIHDEQQQCDDDNDDVDDIQMMGVVNHTNSNAGEETTSSSSAAAVSSAAAASSFLFCARGCEIRTPLGSTVRHYRRMQSLQAIFQYQEECFNHIQQLLKRSEKRKREDILATAVNNNHNNNSNAVKRNDTRNVCNTSATIGLTSIMDPEMVRKLYVQHTQQSVYQAQLMGQMDFHHVADMMLSSCD